MEQETGVSSYETEEHMHFHLGEGRMVYHASSPPASEQSGRPLGVRTGGCCLRADLESTV